MLFSAVKVLGLNCWSSLGLSFAVGSTLNLVIHPVPPFIIALSYPLSFPVPSLNVDNFWNDFGFRLIGSRFQLAFTM